MQLHFWKLCSITYLQASCPSCFRGAPDPDPDPAGYPVNLVDPDPTEPDVSGSILDPDPAGSNISGSSPDPAGSEVGSGK